MSAAPTPVLEMPKQVVIVGADALMCLGIAKCYFGDDFTFELVKPINEIVNSFSGEGPVPIMPEARLLSLDEFRVERRTSGGASSVMEGCRGRVVSSPRSVLQGRMVAGARGAEA
jgi:hypothetical protein